MKDLVLRNLPDDVLAMLEEYCTLRQAAPEEIIASCITGICGNLEDQAVFIANSSKQAWIHSLETDKENWFEELKRSAEQVLVQVYGFTDELDEQDLFEDFDEEDFEELDEEFIDALLELNRDSNS